jgi:hypothetical protein
LGLQVEADTYRSEADRHVTVDAERAAKIQVSLNLH